MVIVTSTVTMTKCNTGRIFAINPLEQSAAQGTMQVLGFETTVTFPSKSVTFSTAHSLETGQISSPTCNLFAQHNLFHKHTLEASSFPC